MGDFMSRPTDVLRSYMATHGFPEGEADDLLRMGRIAMALEILTVVKVLEDHQLMAEHEQMISVLMTLLVDQGLLGIGEEYYAELSEWRRIKADEVSVSAHGVHASEPGVRLHVVPPPDSTDALHGSDQTKDPPSSD